MQYPNTKILCLNQYINSDVYVIHIKAAYVCENCFSHNTNTQQKPWRVIYEDESMEKWDHIRIANFTTNLEITKLLWNHHRNMPFRRICGEKNEHKSVESHPNETKRIGSKMLC